MLLTRSWFFVLSIVCLHWLHFKSHLRSFCCCEKEKENAWLTREIGVKGSTSVTLIRVGRIGIFTYVFFFMIMVQFLTLPSALLPIQVTAFNCPSSMATGCLRYVALKSKLLGFLSDISIILLIIIHFNDDAFFQFQWRTLERA